MNATAEHYRYVSEYLALAREAFAATARGQRVRLAWNGRALDAAQWRASFRRALHRRINAKGGVMSEGRKHSPEYQTGLVRDAERVRARLQRRVRFYQFETAEVRARLGHLLSDRADN